MTRDPDPGDEFEIEIEVDSSAGLYDLKAKAPAAVDAGLVAAHWMIKGALNTDRKSSEAVLAGGSLILAKVPAAWVDVVGDAWNDAASEFCRSRSPDYDFIDAAHHERHRAARIPSIIVRSRSNLAAHTLGEHECHALRTGRGVVVVCGVSDEAPPRLIEAADAVCTISLIDADGLRDVAEAVGTGRPEVSLDATDGLEPADLHQAQRSGQSGADFIRRVVRIASSRRTQAVPPAPRWTLDTFPLPRALEVWGRQLVRDMAAYRAGTLGWADVDRGALLYGPTGCGKTMAATAIAASLGVPLITGGYGIWDSADNGRGRLHDVIGNMRLSFAQARQSPCVLVIDELDAFIARGAAGHNESWFRPLMSALLVELDGIDRRDGVVAIGTTNFRDRIDPALRRAGRLDREFELPMPDRQGLNLIMRAQLGGALMGVDLDPAARAAIGGSGADCEKWSRGARRRARIAGREMQISDLMAEIRDRGTAGTPDHLRRLALREAGHAVACWVRRPGSVVDVTLRPGPRVARSEAFETLSALDAYTREAVIGLIIELLAGRAAEDIILDEVATGSIADLAQASELAVLLDVSLGLRGALLSYGEPSTVNIRAALERPDVREHADNTMHAAYEEALALIRTHRAAVIAVADALLDREALTGAELAGFIGIGQLSSESRH